MSCVICKKIEERKLPSIIENEHARLIHYEVSEENPLIYKGHLFVEPKRHVESYADLTEAESAAVAKLIHYGTRAQKEHLKPEHVYIFTIMHQVAHLHFHLVPRYAGTPEKYWDRGLHDWPEAPKLDEAGVLELTEKLKETVN